jgi:hypothetical protein
MTSHEGFHAAAGGDAYACSCGLVGLTYEAASSHLQAVGGSWRGTDVGYVQASDGSQTVPVREILRAQRRFQVAQDKELRERAFRERAGMQVLLLHCLCCYPLAEYETSSEHADWCPSHAVWQSQQEVRKRYGGDGNG